MDANQTMEAYFTLPEHARISIFEPHMHAPGYRMCLEAIWGITVETLNCAGYDHSWVRVYTYEDDAAPLLPKGTILRITGYFTTRRRIRTCPIRAIGRAAATARSTRCSST